MMHDVEEKPHAIGDAGRWLPKKCSGPSHFSRGSALHRFSIVALCASYAATISFIDAGIGSDAHSAFCVLR